jgi:hypothetical protein
VIPAAVQTLVFQMPNPVLNTTTTSTTVPATTSTSSGG